MSKTDYGMSDRMQEVLKEHPYLKNAFVGMMVDWEFKGLIRESNFILAGTYKITGQGFFVRI